MVQVLTLQGVQEAAQRAYDEERLVAQHRELPVYRDEHGHVCAVGAAMNEETLASVSGSTETWPAAKNYADLRVSALSRDGVVEVTAEDRGGIEMLQRSHDNWATASAQNSERTKNMEQHFVHLLGASLESLRGSARMNGLGVVGW